MIEDRIAADYKEAMKARDEVRTRTLSFLRSELKYCAIDKKKDRLEDADAVGVVKKLIKQRQESIEQFQKGGRQDLVDKEAAELSVLKTYVPQALSEAELAAAVEAVAAETGASGMKDMGRVMKEVLARTEGRADSKMLSDIVRKRLGGAS